MTTTTYIGPIDAYLTEDGGEVYQANGTLIAHLRNIGPHAKSVTDLNGTELGRVYWGGWMWDASVYLPAEDCYRLLGNHHSLEAAILAVLRSHR